MNKSKRVDDVNDVVTGIPSARNGTQYVFWQSPSRSVAQCNRLLDHVWLGAENRLALSQKQIEAAFGQGTQRKGSLAKTTTL